MQRPAPNQFGDLPLGRTTTGAEMTGIREDRDRVDNSRVNPQSLSLAINTEEDDYLTTDCCPGYSESVSFRVPHHIPPVKSRSDNDSPGSDVSSPSQRITIESLRQKGDPEGEIEIELEDDRSSILSESSLASSAGTIGSDQVKQRTTVIDLPVDSKKRLAETAINYASDAFQDKSNASARLVGDVGPLVKPNRGTNHGYIISEVEMPGMTEIEGRNGREMIFREPNGVVTTKSASNTETGSSPLSPQTTAIFNDSTDITLGNKTYITGSVTIKQYMKDAESSAPPTLWDTFVTHKKMTVTVVIVVLLLLISLAVGLAFLDNGQSRFVGVRDGDDGRLITPSKSRIGEDQGTSGSVLRMVSRGEWVAQPANEDLTGLDLPVDRVIIAHTATDNCTSQSTCVFRVRYIQNFHIESQNFSDIGYNFLVGGDGAVYEGRGWDKQGAHTRGYNKGSICIAFIGTYTKVAPIPRQLNVAKLLLEEGVRRKKLTEEYRLYGARQFFGTESPGEKLYDIIKTWKHWTKVAEDEGEMAKT